MTGSSSSTPINDQVPGADVAPVACAGRHGRNGGRGVVDPWCTPASPESTASIRDLRQQRPEQVPGATSSGRMAVPGAGRNAGRPWPTFPAPDCRLRGAGDRQFQLVLPGQPVIEQVRHQQQPGGSARATSQLHRVPLEQRVELHELQPGGGRSPPWDTAKVCSRCRCCGHRDNGADCPPARRRGPAARNRRPRYRRRCRPHDFAFPPGDGGHVCKIS